MAEFYPQLHSLHLLTVILSGSLFLLRGLLVAAGRGSRALAPLPRYLSYSIDTVLLAAAITLVAILPGAAFANGWLYAKLALLPVYVVLGFLALRSDPTSLRQRLCLAGALLAFAAMFLIARSHDPAGPLRHILRI